MPGVAILKPDHLGDLVLASPAIRAISRHYCDVTLFVASGSRGLARFLFGETVEIRSLDFQHLSRRPIQALNLEHVARDLDRFDFLFCLREDSVMRALLTMLRTPHRLAPGNDLTHETASQKRALTEVIGPYSRTGLFTELPICWPAAPRNLGLCVAAGFPTNRWPNACWLDLASRFAREGFSVTLIGGPHERDDLRLLSRLLPHVSHQIVQGGDDVSEFLDAIAEVDLVVASDGGTAHICSLRKPICSIFGSSPWRRYAPFGRDNVLITRDEMCSPCIQFSHDMVNGCLTRECVTAVQPRLVVRVALSNGLDLRGSRSTRVERAVSHRQLQ